MKEKKKEISKVLKKEPYLRVIIVLFLQFHDQQLLFFYFAKKKEKCSISPIHI
jgi:hypothetical protein